MTHQPLDYDTPPDPRQPVIWIAVAVVFALIIVIGAPLLLFTSVHSGSAAPLPIGRDPTITPSGPTTSYSTRE